MSEHFQLAVLGNPVAQSKSPMIHRAFGEQLGLSVSYEAIPCDADELADQLARLWSMNYCGLNLTVPLKEKASALCCEIKAPSALAGSVNTLIRNPDGWVGTSTDGEGLVNDLEALNIALKDQRVLILGAGGAVAGICGELLAAGASRVTVMNRSYDRAKALCDRFKDPRMLALSNPPTDTALDTGQPYDVLIQGTSVGHVGQCPPIKAHWLRAQASIYDLNYGPAHLPMAQWAKDHGFKIYDGLGMLVRQAARSFEIWTGQKPDVAPVMIALRST